MPAAPVHFTLYGRGYCHLCDDMLAALNALQDDARPFTVEVVDVDVDAALVARFDELVPVLFADLAAPELCHYFLDPAAVHACLAGAAAG
ncbi:MAG: glutaredoxin family protein [Pseudomonadota bacterium]|nr:glutaredoxin family protein [Pseudomonadota bacterium]